ncbi:MAG: ATP-binding protein [Clostridia bacterium]|nr:ATP-binding protein [Clostridia bacterium]
MFKGDVMLKKFSVKNFRGFEKEIVFDLSKTNDYQFNTQCVNNGIAKNVLIYGKNGSGKSNIGFALFDIILTLTDYSRHMTSHYSNYRNLNNSSKETEFKYEFLFGENSLQYEYRKLNMDTMTYEILKYNDEIVIEYDFKNKDKKIINIEEAKNLNWKYEDESNISAVRYIVNNTILSPDNPLNKLMDFVNGMLWFRCVRDNDYIGIKNGSESLNDIVINKNKLKDFEKFLKEHGLNYELTKLQESSGNKIGVKYKNGTASFSSIISTGTMSLWLYYCWRLIFENVKFVFIDEFDANYHFELAADIIKYLNSLENIQSIVTTHNVSLMSNKITRPDCVYIITDNKTINNLSNCTEKELREAHNIEKLYREGSFTE